MYIYICIYICIYIFNVYVCVFVVKMCILYMCGKYKQIFIIYSMCVYLLCNVQHM
jgi:hypothetical protein